jgi:(2Fe-2S) ferredoxin
MASRREDVVKTVLVCTNVDCHERGSEAVLARLCALADERDLDVEVRDYLCFSACEKGPNVVVVEDRVWYAGVQEGDADTIAQQHLEDGNVVSELTEDTDAITRNLIFTVLDAGILPGSV